MHSIIHDRVVPVMLKVLFKALKWRAPCYAERVGIGFIPFLETLQLLHQKKSIFVCRHVDKSMPKGQPTAEIHWHMDKIISAVKPCLAQEFTNQVPSVPMRQIAQD